MFSAIEETETERTGCSISTSAPFLAMFLLARFRAGGGICRTGGGCVVMVIVEIAAMSGFGALMRM